MQASQSSVEQRRACRRLWMVARSCSSGPTRTKYVRRARSSSAFCSSVKRSDSCAHACCLTGRYILQTNNASLMRNWLMGPLPSAHVLLIDNCASFDTR